MNGEWLMFVVVLLLHGSLFFEASLMEQLGLHTSDVLSKFSSLLSKTSFFLPHLFEMIEAVAMQLPPVLNIITLRLY